MPIRPVRPRCPQPVGDERSRCRRECPGARVVPGRAHRRHGHWKCPCLPLGLLGSPTETPVQPLACLPCRIRPLCGATRDAARAAPGAHRTPLGPRARRLRRLGVRGRRLLYRVHSQLVHDIGGSLSCHHEATNIWCAPHCAPCLGLHRSCLAPGGPHQRAAAPCAGERAWYHRTSNLLGLSASGLSAVCHPRRLLHSSTRDALHVLADSPSRKESRRSGAPCETRATDPESSPCRTGTQGLHHAGYHPYCVHGLLAAILRTRLGEAVGRHATTGCGTQLRPLAGVRQLGTEPSHLCDLPSRLPEGLQRSPLSAVCGEWKCPLGATDATVALTAVCPVPRVTGFPGGGAGERPPSATPYS